MPASSVPQLSTLLTVAFFIDQGESWVFHPKVLIVCESGRAMPAAGANREQVLGEDSGRQLVHFRGMRTFDLAW
ncbi:MAG: hypothetical protein QOE41_1797 [Mycobacterium sp.]|nr:hypothetical protein [Mycobacterium sp.]